ncbi:3-hydroxybutyryl-CoA dehydrogenase [Bacillus aquiflavi]|uniref:3-hydroxybutyryl-CoA dehydrogenase n=1 Tax=Bacillus aquiflavi TaxID=2672567 RepID=A0A6B3VXZ5_9BACI|nr:3-hydroxyacyl-CoA dehydrogenase family protein [Bacillus aquiflavi]MBA4538617.1 3-hydroxybutyryl-CoA dehydrogenase [Bacillus aquiflavi]NEY82979.1 3-hydroxybutyryl-CoA dehydrogenase [Bacillus aquiflavi]UAC49837.1 3-hydroxybutyryl-CoA dehydrogenase [Bacillus aquiflavi]
MSELNILISGENLLAKELFHAFQAKGMNQVALNDISERSNITVAIETENLHVEKKKQNLKEIEAFVPASTLILTTTLRVTATEVASWLSYPERLIGFGTFVGFMDGKAIEIAPSLQAESHYLQEAKATFSAIGQGIEVVEDEVGLVFPRILSMIINEAAFALTEGTASVRDIDIAMKKGTNYPLGPFEWAKKIGLEDVYSVLSGMYEQFKEERYRPAPLIRKLVHAGWVGGQTNKCFYHYQNMKTKELAR